VTHVTRETHREILSHLDFLFCGNCDNFNSYNP